MLTYIYPLVLVYLFAWGVYYLYYCNWQDIWDWLNPYNFTKGFIDGNMKRALEEEVRERQRQDAAHNAAMEQIQEIPAFDPCRAGGRIHLNRIEGSITGHAAPPDAEFIRRYGAPKTMTLETLEKLMEERSRKDENR